MKKLIFILSMALFLVPFVHAANITAESTPCDSYTTLYQKGSTLNLDKFCLIRSCIAENKSGSFYFKYSSDHKDRMSLTIKSFSEGIFEFSNGVTATVPNPNESKMVDLDSNGFYDEQINYEFSKPDLSQVCFKIYELKESAKFKVPSANDLALQTKTTTNTNTTTTNLSTQKSNASAVASNTSILATQTNHSTVNLNNISHDATNILVTNVTSPVNNSNTNTTVAPATTPKASESVANVNESVEKTDEKTYTIPTTSLPETKSTANIEGKNEIVEGTVDTKTAEKTAQAPDIQSSTKRIIIGTTITLLVIALILAIYLIYEKKRKSAFTVDINKEVGTINIEKKE